MVSSWMRLASSTLAKIGLLTGETWRLLCITLLPVKQIGLLFKVCVDTMLWLTCRYTVESVFSIIEGKRTEVLFGSAW